METTSWSFCNLGLTTSNTQTHREAGRERGRHTLTATDTPVLRYTCSRWISGQPSASWQACFRSACPAFWRAAPASLCDPEVQFRSFRFSMGLSLKLGAETQNPRYLFYVFQTETTNSAAAQNWKLHPHLLWWFGTVSFYCVTHNMYQTAIYCAYGVAMIENCAWCSKWDILQL